MHQNINSKKNNSRLIECLKICIESLDWIEENSPIHGVNRDRARATLKEVQKILKK